MERRDAQPQERGVILLHFCLYATSLLLILSSLVIRADGKIVNAELEYVKKFFVDTFGIEKANKYF